MNKIKSQESLKNPICHDYSGAPYFVISETENLLDFLGTILFIHVSTGKTPDQ